MSMLTVASELRAEESMRPVGLVRPSRIFSTGSTRLSFVIGNVKQPRADVAALVVIGVPALKVRTDGVATAPKSTPEAGCLNYNTHQILSV